MKNKTKFPNLLNLEGLEYSETTEALKLLTLYNEKKTTRKFKYLWKDNKAILKIDRDSPRQVYLTNDNNQVAVLDSTYDLIEIITFCDDCGNQEPSQDFNGNLNCWTCYKTHAMRRDIMKQL